MQRWSCPRSACLGAFCKVYARSFWVQWLIRRAWSVASHKHRGRLNLWSEGQNRCAQPCQSKTQSWVWWHTALSKLSLRPWSRDCSLSLSAEAGTTARISQRRCWCSCKWITGPKRTGPSRQVWGQVRFDWWRTQLSTQWSCSQI